MSGESWDLIRIGVVSAVDVARARVKCHFEQLAQTSDWLPVLQQGARAGGGRAYWLPVVGDEVVCAFYSDGTEEGVVLGSYYPADAPPPASGAGVRYVVFPDGSMVKWDNGHLTVVAVAGVAITADIVVTGDLSITGDLTVTGATQLNGDAHCTGTIYAALFVQT
jgi:phage baseplate assembly protein V